MKKTQRCMAWMLLLSIMLAAMPSVGAKAAAKPKTMAHAYYVMDAKSGEKILSDRANKKIYPASTVKLLTALTVLDYADVNQTIKFTRKLQKKIPSDASALNLKTGRRYTVKQYLNMLLIVSDAGSALALAEGTAGNVETFVEYMNDKAEELGMKHSHFDNPVGLDKGS